MKVSNKKAIVLVSGGLDSAVCASIAKEQGFDLYFLNIRYGQKTEDKEYESFLKLADHFNVADKKSVNISYLKDFGCSFLTDDNIKEEKTVGSKKFVHNSFVPFRNGNMLSIATSWAETIYADEIFIGATYDDYTGYPDCRSKFFKAFNKVIDLSTAYTDVKISTPLIKMKKKDIIAEGIRLKTPFELTWSCYVDNDLSCGKCASCYLRLKGFKAANAIDPIPYR